MVGVALYNSKNVTWSYANEREIKFLAFKTDSEIRQFDPFYLHLGS